MIIAWWCKERPELIELVDEDILPWINANWIEKRPATPEELELYNKGIHHYKLGVK